MKNKKIVTYLAPASNKMVAIFFPRRVYDGETILQQGTIKGVSFDTNGKREFLPKKCFGLLAVVNEDEYSISRYRVKFPISFEFPNELKPNDVYKKGINIDIDEKDFARMYYLTEDIAKIWLKNLYKETTENYELRNKKEKEKIND